MVLAPEHPYVKELTRDTEFEKDVDTFLDKLQHLSDLDRTSGKYDKKDYLSAIMQ